MQLHGSLQPVNTMLAVLSSLILTFNECGLNYFVMLKVTMVAHTVFGSFSYLSNNVSKTWQPPQGNHSWSG